ncbi:MAG: hypothetical protein KDA28_07675, partial [Phycisphaerales bacterium]|nr:hypothetical protein [Phycisphaerales bacterium]
MTIAWPIAGLVSGTFGAITPIDPFVGDVTDTFNRFRSTQAVQTLDVFDLHGTISNLTEDGAIKIERTSSLGGDEVRNRSGWMMGQLGIARWDFVEPAVRFGGWFENNSGDDDATLTF